MRSLPRVVSPIATLFADDGIEVLLVSVELWPRGLVVRLAARANAITDARLQEYERVFEEWDRIRVTTPELAGPPPEQPGVLLLQPLEVSVDDDAGTVYLRRSAATGGSGREWHGDWFFDGDVPPTIRRLTVRVERRDGEPTTVALDVDVG